MAQVYLISDTHFFHLNIAKKRGFETVEEMNDLIIKNWNSTINKNDKIFILGDCTMEKKEHYNIFGKLNGNKTFILGNHCKEQGPNDLIKYGKVAGMLKYRGFWLTHCPIHPMELRGLKNIHGHCISKDSEILTVNGWKSYDTISKEDLIYSVDDGIVKAGNINDIIINKNYSGYVYRGKFKSVKIDVTDEHRMYDYSDNNMQNVIVANDFFSKRARKIRLSGVINNKGIGWSNDELKLYIILAADGNINKRTNLGRVMVKKTYKIDYIEQLLNRLKIPFTKNKQKSGSFTFNFQMPKIFSDLQIKGLDSILLNANKNDCYQILDAYENSDGCRNGKGIIIYSGKEYEIDLLQHIFCINGFSATKYSRFHGFANTLNHQLSVYEREFSTINRIDKAIKKEYVENELYWCISTTYENFFTRLNGKVYLTGNCHENSVKRYGLFKDKRYINVCVDVTDYKPVLFEDLIK